MVEEGKACKNNECSQERRHREHRRPRKQGREKGEGRRERGKRGEVEEVEEVEMRIGKLVVVSSVYGKIGQRKTDDFVKKFYGQATTSHRGKYRYRRRGLLDDVPHIKLGRGVIIIRPIDLDRVTRFLDEWEVDYTTRDIVLNPADQKVLTQKPTE